MNRHTLNIIAACCEAATAPSNDLNADIYEALGYDVIRTPRNPGGIYWRFRGRGALDREWHDRWEVQQQLTREMSMALAIVPAGWHISVHSTDPGGREGQPPRPYAEVWNGKGGVEEANGATMALAACAAALRAQSAVIARVA